MSRGERHFLLHRRGIAVLRRPTIRSDATWVEKRTLLPLMATTKKCRRSFSSSFSMRQTDRVARRKEQHRHIGACIQLSWEWVWRATWIALDGAFSHCGPLISSYSYPILPTFPLAVILSYFSTRFFILRDSSLRCRLSGSDCWSSEAECVADDSKRNQNGKSCTPTLLPSLPLWHFSVRVPRLSLSSYGPAVP